MAHPRMPHERLEAMQAAYRSGLTLAQVATQFGLSPSRVSVILAQSGCSRRKPGPRGIWHAIAEEAERLYRQGLTLRETAASLGVSRSTVRAALIDRGCPRTGHWKGYNPGPEAEERDRRIVADYAAGASLREVAHRHGVSHEWVRQCALAAGVLRARRQALPKPPRAEPYRPSPETRAKIADALRGRRAVFTPEHCQHISEAKRRVKDVQVETMAARYLAGETTHEVARNLGLSQGTVARCLRPLGILRPSGHQKRGDDACLPARE